MKPKVLFVVLPYLVQPDASGPKIRSFLGFPYGLLSVATYCKDLAEIRIIDLNVLKTIEFEIAVWKPDIVGFSMMFDNSYSQLSNLLSIVKKYNPNILILLGGAAASYSYEEILKEQPDLDAVCFGEGEIPMKRLLQSWWRGEGIGMMRWVGSSWVLPDTICGFPPGMDNVEDLDEVIDIDYSFVNPEDYEMKEAFSPFVNDTRKKQFFLMTSRGCPFKCAFCSNSKIHGKKMRFASVQAIMDHIGSLILKYHMDVLTIYDDQMLIDMDRAKKIFQRLAKFNIRVEAPNGFSVAFIDQEMAHLMKKAGMDTVYLAIESGSPYVLKELIHKPLKLQMVKPVIEMLHNAGLFVHGFFVMGMPGETSEHRRETFEFIKNSELDWAGLNMATPVRGSQLYEDCLKNGWIQKQEISDIVDKKYIINVPGIDPAQVEDDVYQMNIDLNFHNNRRMRIGDYQTAANCFAQVLERYPGHKWAKDYLRFCEHKLREEFNQAVLDFFSRFKIL